MMPLTEDERRDIYRQSTSVHDAMVRTERAVLEKNVNVRVLCGNCGNYYNAPEQESDHGRSVCSVPQREMATEAAWS